jgi:hypothetical protein
MSNPNKRSRKLALRREFLRRLSPSALDRVAAGTEVLLECPDIPICDPMNESCLRHGSKTASLGC